MNQKFFPILLISFLAITLSACGGGVSSQEATAQALGESISLTATAAASGVFSSGDNLKTAQAQATQDSQAIAATQLASQNLSAEAQSATATAVAPFIAELPKYGVDPSDGYMAWIHPPVTLDIQGYLQYDYANYFIGTAATDFVVSADITWDTSYGTSGCGFVLRSDGNEEAYNQYLAIATRGGNGRVIFSSMVEGEVENAIDNYAYGKDPQFDWQNGTTNRITVVARGEIFTIYTNGTKVGEVAAGKPPVLVLPVPPIAPPANASNDILENFEIELKEYDDLVSEMKTRHQRNIAIYQPDTPYFERGFVALVVLSESGRTICQFDNTWLWIMDD
jgi:hypothetical protein